MVRWMVKTQKRQDNKTRDMTESAQCLAESGEKGAALLAIRRWPTDQGVRNKGENKNKGNTSESKLPQTVHSEEGFITMMDSVVSRIAVLSTFLVTSVSLLPQHYLAQVSDLNDPSSPTGENISILNSAHKNKI